MAIPTFLHAYFTHLTKNRLSLPILFSTADRERAMSVISVDNAHCQCLAQCIILEKSYTSILISIIIFKSMRIKDLLRNRLFYLNVGLILLLGAMVVAPRIGAGRIPALIKQAFAALGPIQGDGTVGKIARASGANQLTDSIMSESGSEITIAGASSQLNVRNIQGGATLGIQGCSGCSSMVFDSSGIRVNTTGTAIFSMGNAGGIAFPGDGAILANLNNGGGRIDLNAAIVALNNTSPGGTDFFATRLHGILVSVSGDYAEWFEKEGDARPGDLIGISKQTGKARKYEQGDHFIGIYSIKPAIAGNTTGTDAEMAKTHILVGLLGQLDFDRSQTVVEGRVVKTPDGVYVGILLSNGKVLIGR